MQTLLVVVLLVKVNAFEARLDETVQPAKPVQADAITISQTASPELAATPSSLGGRQVRRIIREELRGLARSNALSVQTSESVSQSPVYDETEMQYQQQLVIEEMDLLKQQETVSGMELESLMADIAKLDPETRTEMMKELTQSMNRGEINGRF